MNSSFSSMGLPEERKSLTTLIAGMFVSFLTILHANELSSDLLVFHLFPEYVDFQLVVTSNSGLEMTQKP